MNDSSAQASSLDKLADEQLSLMANVERGAVDENMRSSGEMVSSGEGCRLEGGERKRSCSNVEVNFGGEVGTARNAERFVCWDCSMSREKVVH